MTDNNTLNSKIPKISYLKDPQEATDFKERKLDEIRLKQMAKLEERQRAEKEKLKKEWDKRNKAFSTRVFLGMGGILLPLILGTVASIGSVGTINGGTVPQILTNVIGAFLIPLVSFSFVYLFADDHTKKPSEGLLSLECRHECEKSKVKETEDQNRSINRGKTREEIEELRKKLENLNSKAHEETVFEGMQAKFLIEQKQASLRRSSPARKELAMQLRPSLVERLHRERQV